MTFILRLSTFVLACFFIIACNSGENENQAASTNSSIWVLDSINNKAPDSNFFSHGTPYLDFNLQKKTFTGHTGCNGISGNLTVQGERLVFDSIVVTSQTCRNKDFERKFVNGFKSGKTTYKLLNGNLHLHVGPGTNLIFRKIRR